MYYYSNLVTFTVEMTAMEIKLTGLEECVKTRPNIAVKETQVCSGSSDVMKICTV